MKCNEVLPLIDPLLDNELPTQPTALLMEHIGTCTGCQDAWDGRLGLRERFRRFATAIPIPQGGLERLDQALQNVVQRQTRFTQLKRGLLWTAAAALVLVPVSVLTMQKISTGSSAPASVAEIVDTFRTEQLTSLANENSSNLASLSQKAGFTITDLKMPHWQLSSAKMLKLPQHSQCIVRLVYVRKLPGKTEQIACYQSCQGQITSAGLSEHSVKGRYFCCGKISDLSVVYWPNQGKDHLLVSSLSERDLVTLAFGT